MNSVLREKILIAREALRAGAEFVVYEHGGHWYELTRRIRRVCGALKKTGERCRSKDLHRGGKCKFHGGLSTGPRTPEGKARSIAAMHAGRWKRVTL